MALTDYRLDPTNPRAPSQAQWDQMTPDERRRVVEQLPSEPPGPHLAPEGDRHRIPKERAVQTLGEYFKRMGRSIYLSAELPVYYPDSPWFAPDLIAVLDVEPHLRSKWVVAEEKRGLDFVLEITLSGDRRKDLVDNVDRYAQLEIPEYFVLDLQSNRLFGFRLISSRSYEPIVPQGGRWSSRILGLDLTLQQGKIRFCSGSAVLLESDELVAQLTTIVDELVRKEQDLAEALEQQRNRAAEAERRAEEQAARAEEQAARAEEQAARAEEQAARAEEQAARAEALAAKLHSLGIEPES